jgi:hypothetical protein
MRTRPSLAALSPRDRRAVRLGAWILLPALLAGLVIRPWAAALIEGRAVNERQRTLLAHELRLLVDTSRDRRELAIARRALDESAPRLFSGAEAVTASAELARYLAQLASRSALRVEQTETVLEDTVRTAARSVDSPSNVDTDTSGQPLRVVVRAHGNARAIVAFLYALEQGPKLVRVERLAISHGIAGAEADAGVLTFTATVSGLARSRFDTSGLAEPRARMASNGRPVAGGAP